MTSDTDVLIERLKATSERILEWRRETDRLRATAGAVGGKDTLVEVEELAGQVYDGIAEFEALLLDVDRKSHSAAAEIAAVGDALRLVLLEITEISLIMYRLEGSEREAA